MSRLLPGYVGNACQSAGDLGCALSIMENKRSLLDMGISVSERVDPIFYGEVRQAAFKALGVG